MNLRIPLALATFALAALVVTSTASPASAQPPAAGAMDFDVEGRVTELRARLALDPNQTTQVRTILGDARAEIERLRADARADGPGGFEALRDRRRAILFRVEDRIWAILSCTQKDAFRLYVREQLEARHDHRGRPDARRGRHR